MSNRIPVGECPEHGYVYDDDIDVDFPNPAQCDKDGCGEYLVACTFADRDEVMKRA